MMLLSLRFMVCKSSLMSFDALNDLEFAGQVGLVAEAGQRELDE